MYSMLDVEDLKITDVIGRETMDKFKRGNSTHNCVICKLRRERVGIFSFRTAFGPGSVSSKASCVDSYEYQFLIKHESKLAKQAAFT